LLYPVYNHCMSITDAEFQSVAYAFLDSLARLGAGNPKGLRIAEGSILDETQPLLVVDRYLAPLGKRPIISPALTEIERTLASFTQAAISVYENEPQTTYSIERNGHIVFQRWVGQAALTKLQD